MKHVEVCTDSYLSAIMAQVAGATRIELCAAASLPEGGTTPTPSLIQMAQGELVDTKLYVLIRPRGGDFLYDDREFEMMQSDIHMCGKLKCDGVVIGMLNSDGTIDTAQCRELVDIAKSYAMGVTFHRAFDRCADLFQGLEDAISLGCERILTSGGKNTAIEGAPIIKQLIDRADGRISIMPGAGLTPENVAELIRQTGANEVHGTFRSLRPSRMTYRNTALGNPEQEYNVWWADLDKVRKVVDIVSRI